MRGRWQQRFLIAIAATMAAAALIFVLRPPEIGSPPLPTTAAALVPRVAGHPTDWEATTLLTEASLDSQSRTRMQLWRAAYDHASRLAPGQPGPASSFARAAFFHWQELSPKDRQDALNAYAPLLGDRDRFARMAQPLFELTGDLSLLERARPRDDNSTRLLISLALRNGLFDDYRKLRGDLARERLEEFKAYALTNSPADLIDHLPEPPYRTDSEPLIAVLLEDLHRRPLDESPGRPAVVDAFVDYALRHDLRPLDGLEPITLKPRWASDATRVRLARKLGLNDRAAQIEFGIGAPLKTSAADPGWQGLCGLDVCSSAWRNIDANHAVTLAIQTVRTDNVPAYAEVYVDDVLRDEGTIGAKRDFIVPVGNPGAHRVEVVLANPVTRNGDARTLHISSIKTL